MCRVWGDVDGDVGVGGKGGVKGRSWIRGVGGGREECCHTDGRGGNTCVLAGERTAEDQRGIARSMY